LLAAALGVLGGAWLVWVATSGADPAVSARVDAFQVVSATDATATVSIQRPDPTVAVECLVYAQAVSYERVGELPLKVPPGTSVHTTVDVALRTFKTATTVQIESCRPIG
jgi:HAMP domain-containing protein